MTRRDPSIWLASDEPRCEPAVLRYGCASSTCARYLAPIDGAPLGDLFATAAVGGCANFEPVRRRPPAETPARPVHKPLRGM